MRCKRVWGGVPLACSWIKEDFVATPDFGLLGAADKEDPFYTWWQVVHNAPVGPDAHNVMLLAGKYFQAPYVMAFLLEVVCCCLACDQDQLDAIFGQYVPADNVLPKQSRVLQSRQGVSDVLLSVGEVDAHVGQVLPKVRSNSFRDGLPDGRQVLSPIPALKDSWHDKRSTPQ